MIDDDPKHVDAAYEAAMHHKKEKIEKENEVLGEAYADAMERITELETELQKIAMWAEYGYQDLNSGGVLSHIKKHVKQALAGDT